MQIKRKGLGEKGKRTGGTIKRHEPTGGSKLGLSITPTHLGVAANLLLTLLAGVGEFRFVAGQTVRLLISEDVALTG